MKERLATLWIGSRLSFLELLCLKSMADVGQTPILYRYEPIENEPDFVEVRDAREVLDTSYIKSIWGQETFADPRLWSDIFRIKLMVNTPYIWVDADAYALREHKSVDGYFFARKRKGSKGFIPNGVLRLPQQSEAVRLLDRFVSREGTIPPWWSEAQAGEYLKAHPKVSFQTLPLGITGPESLGYFLDLTGESSRAMGFRMLYPLRARSKGELLDAPRNIGLDSFGDSFSLHLYATGMRRRLMRSGGVPEPGSLLDHLCEISDIDMAANPVMHRD